MSRQMIAVAFLAAALLSPFAASAADLQAVAEPQRALIANTAALPAELLQLAPDDRAWTEKVPRDFLLGAARTGGELDCIVVFRQPQALKEFTVVAFDHPGRLRWIADAAAEIDRDFSPLGVKMLRRYSHLPMAHVTLPAGMLAHLAGDSRVEAVAPNRVAHAFRAEGKALMHVPQVAALGYSGSGVTVALLDSGVDYTHAELSPGGTTSAAKTIKGLDAIDNDGDPMDGEGHGTSTAGIVAGSTGGVAPSAKIYAVRVLDNSGEGSVAQILAGINDVVSQVSGGNPFNIKVMNMSLGGYYESGVPPQPCDADFPEFVTPMNTLISAGVLPVLSAGNGGCTTGVAWPACISSTLSVGAVYDANIGSDVSFGSGQCTPSGCSDAVTGADIVTCYSDSGAERLDVWGPSHCATTPALGGGYTACFGGTSAAAPYVAGMAALLTQAVPGRTATGLKDAIRNNGVDVTDPRNSVTRKSVRADSALTALQGGSCTAPSVPAGLQSSKSTTCAGQPYTLSWNAVSGAANYTIEVATDAAFTNKLSLSQSTFTGTAVSLTINGSYVGPLYHHVRANASCGTSSAYSSAVQVSYTGTNCSGPTYTKTYYVSGIAHTAGVPPAYWYSDLGILNHGASAAQVRVSFYGGTTPTPYTATVGVGQQVTKPDVLVSGFAMTGTDVGVIVVESTSAVSVLARTFSKVRDACTGKDRTDGQSYPGYEVSKALANGQVGYLPNLRSDDPYSTGNGYRTNVEAVNVGTAAIDVQWTFYTNTRSLITTVTRTGIQPNRRVGVTAALPSGQSAAFAEVRVLTAGGKAICFASVVDGTSTDPTTVDLVIP